MISIRDQFCPNPLCRTYGINLGAYVAIHSRKENRLKCKLCRKTWVSHRHEWRYGLRTDVLKLQRAHLLASGGMSVRKIAQAVCVSPSTVQRWKPRLKSF